MLARHGRRCYRPLLDRESPLSPLASPVAGCEYLSDEVALVDLESGMLHPFPRALGMSQRSIGFITGLLERLPPELGAEE